MQGLNVDVITKEETIIQLSPDEENAAIERSVAYDLKVGTLLNSLAQKTSDITSILPDWSTVKAKFDQGQATMDKATTDLAAAGSLAAVKLIVASMITVMKGLLDVTFGIARIVYWLAKNTAA